MAQQIRDYPSIPTKLMPGGGNPFPSTPSGPPSGGGEVMQAGTIINRQNLITSYANLAARCWVDEAFLQLLLSEPVATLAKSGLPTIPGAVVRVVQMKITGMGKIEEQVDKWIEGARTGLYDLYLPMKPDGIDLPGVGGGDTNCCCTPCCCCT